MKLVNMKFSMNDQAVAVLKRLVKVDMTKLDGFKPEDKAHVCISTSIWYNGRERGFALTVQDYSSARRPVFVITVSESRGTDDIVIDNWTMNHVPWNYPVSNDFPADAYHNRRQSVPYEEYDKAVMIVLTLVEKWLAHKIVHEENDKKES